MTIPEYAKVADKSRQYVHRLVIQKRIKARWEKAVRGGYWVIDPSEVRKLKRQEAK